MAKMSELHASLNDIAVALNADDYNQALYLIYQLVAYQNNQDFITDQELQDFENSINLNEQE